MRRRALFFIMAAVILLLAIVALLGGDIVDAMKDSSAPLENSKSLESDGTFGRETVKGN